MRASKKKAHAYLWIILSVMFIQFAIMKPTLPNTFVKQSEAARKINENKTIR